VQVPPAPEQESAVQGFPSLQSAATLQHPAALTWVQVPPAPLHEAVVHPFESVQSEATLQHAALAGWAQDPAAHTSVVQAFPSSAQGEVLFGFLQEAVVTSQTSSVQGLPSLQLAEEHGA
jgi:hypothetical protein